MVARERGRGVTRAEMIAEALGLPASEATEDAARAVVGPVAASAAAVYVAKRRARIEAGAAYDEALRVAAHNLNRAVAEATAAEIAMRRADASLPNARARMVLRALCEVEE